MAKVGIKYTEFETAASNIKTSGQRIGEIEQSLNSAQQAAMGAWIGEDADKFETGYKKFQKDMKEMKNVIYSIEKWMTGLANNYKEEEKKAKSVYEKMF